MRIRIMMLCSTLSLTLLLSACSLVPGKINSSPQFDNALFYAKVSDLSYKTDAQIPPGLTALGLTLKKTGNVSGTEVQYFVAEDTRQEHQIISVRGTANPENVIVDAKFVFIDVESLGIKVHKGFAEASKEVLKDLLKDNADTLDKTKPIIVTGHSLGGAVAVLISMHLQEMGYHIDSIYTYGQPKVTDRHGANKFKSIPLIRYANNKDIVPLVPPLSRDQESHWDIYWHLGKEVLLYPDTRYVQLGADASVLRGLTGYYDDLFKKRDLGAHSLVNYIASLQAKIPTSQEVELELLP
ncbi:MAG: lipase family protein [Gammaproteobacteria bacterium]|nr:lipase family protein [Gammaproteobacteria bacterium]